MFTESLENVSLSLEIPKPICSRLAITSVPLPLIAITRKQFSFPCDQIQSNSLQLSAFCNKNSPLKYTRTSLYWLLATYKPRDMLAISELFRPLLLLQVCLFDVNADNGRDLVYGPVDNHLVWADDGGIWLFKWYREDV